MPIFDPLIKAVGIDPVDFGVVIMLNLMIGLLTPPMGSVIFVTDRRTPWTDAIPPSNSTAGASARSSSTGKCGASIESL